MPTWSTSCRGATSPTPNTGTYAPPSRATSARMIPEGGFTRSAGSRSATSSTSRPEYSAAMNATFTDETGATQLLLGGSYGVGVSRLMAAAVEQHHDENGIRWPIPIAPFEVVVVLVGVKDDAQKQAAEDLYHDLQVSGIDVLLDDRDDRPGVKFKDADLLGIPVKVVVGKSLAEGTVEVSLRRDGANKGRRPRRRRGGACRGPGAVPQGRGHRLSLARRPASAAWFT